MKNLGIVSTLAGNGSAGYLDGPSSLALFNSSYDMCDDGFGNVYVTDSNNYRIRLININTNIGLVYFFQIIISLLFLFNQTQKNLVSTFAGNGTQGTIDGPAFSAELYYPYAILCQPSTSTIYVADNYLRKIQNGEFK